LQAFRRLMKYLTTPIGVFSLLVGVSVVAICWLLYKFIYAYDPILSYDDRIGFVSLWVSIIGFGLAIAGAFIAVIQFQAALRQPDLYLWVEKKGQERITLRKSGGSLPIILENKGKGVARHVKCTLEFPVPRLAGSGLLRRVGMLDRAIGNEDYWRIFRGSASTTLNFIGQDKYICYDEDWDQLGNVQIHWNPQEVKPQHKVSYQLQCEGMKRKSGILVVEIEGAGKQ
jgi:hypothetical protein